MTVTQVHPASLSLKTSGETNTGSQPKGRKKGRYIRRQAGQADQKVAGQKKGLSHAVLLPRHCDAHQPGVSPHAQTAARKSKSSGGRSVADYVESDSMRPKKVVLAVFSMCCRCSELSSVSVPFICSFGFLKSVRVHACVCVCACACVCVHFKKKKKETKNKGITTKN